MSKKKKLLPIAMICKHMRLIITNFVGHHCARWNIECTSPICDMTKHISSVMPMNRYPRDFNLAF